jgi:hypothetical protein
MSMAVDVLAIGAHPDDVDMICGGTLAKLSVSALLFDYVLTGPISAVSAGQYIVGLVIDVARDAIDPVLCVF